MQGAEVYLRSFLTSSLGGGDWLTSHSGRFIPKKGPLYQLNIRPGLGPREGIDVLKKSLAATGIGTLDRLVSGPVA